jgi:hypothetical protein
MPTPFSFARTLQRLELEVVKHKDGTLEIVGDMAEVL